LTISPDGAYSFTGLVAGDYWVREVPQAGWSQTTADPSLITIASGDNFTQADYPGLAFGNFPSDPGSSISGYKFEDLNDNGLDTTSIIGYTDVFTTITTVANRRAQQVTMPEAGTLMSISIYHEGGSGRCYGLNSDQCQCRLADHTFGRCCECIGRSDSLACLGF
jgi:hypothetical protein